MQPDRLRDDLATALGNLDTETRQALGRALERGQYDLEGGQWGDADDGSGCLLSIAAWELGYEHGETLMRRSIDAVRVPALFDAWWAEVLEREGDVVRAQRTVRETIAGFVHRSLAGDPGARLDLSQPDDPRRGASREIVA